jgi:hypothetical protein
MKQIKSLLIWRALNRSPSLKSQKSHCHSSFLKYLSSLGKLVNQEFSVIRACTQLSTFIEIKKIAPRHSFVLFILVGKSCTPRIQLQGGGTQLSALTAKASPRHSSILYVFSMGKPFPRVLSPWIYLKIRNPHQKEAVKSTLVHR